MSLIIPVLNAALLALAGLGIHVSEPIVHIGECDSQIENVAGCASPSEIILTLHGLSYMDGLDHVLAHELVHVWQFERQAFGYDVPHWMVEGFAEHVANIAYPEDRFRGWSHPHADEHAQQTEMSHLAHIRLATTGTTTIHDSDYNFGALAWRLLHSEHGWLALVEFWEMGGNYQDRFEAVFGEDINSFAERFAEWTLRPLPHPAPWQWPAEAL